MKQIAIFNHKGGVSKTTTTFHLGWMLAKLGKRVMVVDGDPQCNLTALFLGDFPGEDYPFESEDVRQPKNIREAVRPAFESRPYPISPVSLFQVPNQPNLHLLPGHVGLAEYESQLAVAHELSNSLSALQNIPGAFRNAIQITGRNAEIDICLIDMSPSLGAINQNLFMTSDAFVIPMAPDLFSSMALKSLARTFPKWAEWGRKAASNSILKEADYPFPNLEPKYLGSVVQNFRKRSRGGGEAVPTHAFEVWFERLRAAKEGDLNDALEAANMLLPNETYSSANANPHGFLMEIATFDGLIASAQSLAKPVFDIDPRNDLGSYGNIKKTYDVKIADIKEKFESGARKIVKLTDSF